MHFSLFSCLTVSLKMYNPGSVGCPVALRSIRQDALCGVEKRPSFTGEVGHTHATVMGTVALVAACRSHVVADMPACHSCGTNEYLPFKEPDNVNRWRSLRSWESRVPRLLTDVNRSRPLAVTLGRVTPVHTVTCAWYSPKYYGTKYAKVAS